MASEDMGLVQAQQRLDNGLSHPHPHLVFPDNSFSCGPPPPQPPRRVSAAGLSSKTTATRELTSGFIDHHHYFHQPPSADFRRATFSSPSSAAAAAASHPDNSHNWNLGSRASATTSGGDGSEDDDDDDDEEEEDDDDDHNNDDDDENEVEGIAASNENINKNSRGKMASQKLKQLSSFGLKEGNVVGVAGRSGNEINNNCEMRNAVTIADADGEMYYSQYLQGTAEVGPHARQKDVLVVENGCGFSGRKEGSYLAESGDSLREILSDPLTGALMDDAMILPCGHSFGSGGIQHVLRMKSCYTCSQAVSEDSVSPNLSLRLAVQAFRREEELQVHRASKRRRERHEQDKGTYGDSVQTDHPRGRGVQFPFAVTDRVIIKGNKRTPPRFVGREAIVTTQCLNGWYVVKTLDNAESVKLQYRSLARVPDNPSPKPIATSKITPNWL
ncbi:unnamed protein product [Coffea canephora]|uniref:U-box domain-containing protein n=1 Tax=Coffea canephora TaxID=49390 RepID=A0A068UZD7_COFCA|nr:unnamed protein product [Coffea canephora]